MLHLVRRIGRIGDSKRSGERMAGRLSRAFSYFMSCVNYFGDSVDLELGMMEKFPSYGCRYCGSLPCACKEKRPDPTEYAIDEKQREWTLKQWQDHMQSVYSHHHQGNFYKPFTRLVSEVGELGILLANGPNTPITPSEMIQECRREAADVLSWLLTIAYIEGVNLEEQVVDRYSACPGCKKPSHCNCNLVFISQDGTQFSNVGTPAFKGG